MLQPGDDALRCDLGGPGNAAYTLAIKPHPVIHQNAGIGGGKFGIGAFKVAQPAKTMQGLFPFRRWRFNRKRRMSAGFDQTPGKGKTAVVKLLCKLRIGYSKIWRSNENTFRSETRKTPSIKRAHAQATASPAPRLC